MVSTRELAEAMVAGGVALRELPLESLPGIAFVDVLGYTSESLRVELQQDSRATPADLAAWAGVLPGSTVTAGWAATDRYIHIEVSGHLRGVPVRVWDHTRDELTATAWLLGLRTDQDDHPVVPVSGAVLERLAQAQVQGVVCDA